MRPTQIRLANFELPSRYRRVIQIWAERYAAPCTSTQATPVSGSVYGNEWPLRGKIQFSQWPVAETETLKRTRHEPSKAVASESNRLLNRYFSTSQGVTSGQG